MFVNIVVCILYRVADESMKEAFYQLSRPQAQIQAYVFDGIHFFAHIYNVFCSYMFHLCLKFEVFNILACIYVSSVITAIGETTKTPITSCGLFKIPLDFKKIREYSYVGVAHS